MPNWVYNVLTVEGSPDSVNKMKEQLSKPFTVAFENMGMGDISASGFPTKLKEVKYTNPVFAFWNIINPLDMGITMEQYASQPTRSNLNSNNPDWWADVQRLAQIDNSWYNWNIRNWGVKWDVANSDNNEYLDTELLSDYVNDKGNRVLIYRFNTPWSVPSIALIKLSTQYPDLLFNLEFEEETGWGGEVEYQRAVETIISEYESRCSECSTTDSFYDCDECDVYVCSSCKTNGDGEQCEHKELLNA